MTGERKTGYIATNAQVVVTLPTEPDIAIGEVIGVKAEGSGTWTIAQNPGQTVKAESLGLVAGATWKRAADADRYWSAVASSADGTKLVAAEGERSLWSAGNVPGLLYTSNDSGLTWTPSTTTPQYWASVASSAKAEVRVAAERNGYIYTSIDGGEWNPVEVDADGAPRHWYSVASSGSGQYLVAMGDETYTSDNKGRTWTKQDSPSWAWARVASSEDGKNLVAAAPFSPIYISTNYGGTWTENGPEGFWLSVASSADASQLVALDLGGQIHISRMGGAWEPYGLQRNAAFPSVASSADGKTLVVVGVDQLGEAGYAAYPIYTSSDYGAEWKEREPRLMLTSVASSADGSKLVATEYYGGIYTSAAWTTAGADGSISGTSSDFIELVYLGNGQFDVLRHGGNPTVR